MLAFTSQQSINKFGKENLLQYYKQKFKLDYLLENLSNITTEDGIIYLTYTKAHINATRRKITIPCVIENDSVKIIINDLTTKPFE